MFRLSEFYLLPCLRVVLFPCFLLHSLSDIDGLLTLSPCTRYKLASYNCWWFAAVMIGTLQVLGSDWTITPSRDWAKRAVNALGKNTSESSQQISKIFAERWHQGIMLDVPITEEGAWERLVNGGGQGLGVVPHPVRLSLPDFLLSEAIQRLILMLCAFV